MANTMVRSSLCLVLILSLSVALTEGAQKPKKVKCKNKAFPECYQSTKNEKLLCPDACLRTCYVDCATCQPVCGTAPPPPPKGGQKSPPPPPPSPVYHHSPPPPSPTYHHSPPPPPSPYYHSPPPPVATPSPSPPPVATPSPPPPPVATPSPPPPPATVPSGSTPSPPPPPVATPSPPPPTVPSATPSPPPPPPVNTPTPSPPSPPPSSEASGAKRVRCRNRNYAKCYGLQLTCPAACPSQCEVDCVTCSPVCNCNKPGAVCQDPRFVGGDGLTFYFHGKKDRHFCLLSDPNLHINALFIGKRSPNPKQTRDFTWIQSLGILFPRHNFSIAALKTPTWDDALDRLAFSLDGLPISLPTKDGATWRSVSSPCVTITRLAMVNSVEVVVEGLFRLRAVVVPITEKESRVHGYGIVDGEDCFAHLDVSFKFDSLSGDVTGVLGQTYAKNYVSRVKMGVLMPVLGGNREFSASGLFSPDCLAAKFVR